MKRSVAMLCLLLAAFPLSGRPAETTRPGAFAEAADRVRRSILDWDFSAMTDAASHLQALVPADDTERFLRALWTGTAAFHAVLYLDGAGGDVAAGLERDATGSLNQAVAINPASSDSHAMLAVLYGMAIARRPLRAISLGPRLNRHREEAARAGATNPRVSYLEGVSLLRRAGSDREVEEAVARLTRAEALFARQADGTLAPDEAGWGRPHTLLFLGEAAERLGRDDEALKWFGEAMRLAPRLGRAERGMERCRLRLRSR